MAADFRFLDDCEITDVVGQNFSKTKEFSKKFKIPNIHGSVDGLLRGMCDAVYIATPHSSHAKIAMKALEANKHVLVEKPFALNLRETQPVVDLARDKKLFLMEAMWTRFLPTLVEVRKMIGQGAIGKLKKITASIGCPMSEDRHPRLYDPELGGGSLLDMGVYAVALAQAFTVGYPTIDNSIELTKRGVDKTAVWTLQYENGLEVRSNSSMCTLLAGDAVFTGEKGEVVIPQFFRARSFCLNGDESHLDFQGTGLHFQIRHFTECISKGWSESEVMPLRDSLQIMKILDAIRWASN